MARHKLVTKKRYNPRQWHLRDTPQHKTLRKKILNHFQKIDLYKYQDPEILCLVIKVNRE